MNLNSIQNAWRSAVNTLKDPIVLSSCALVIVAVFFAAKDHLSHDAIIQTPEQIKARLDRYNCVDISPPVCMARHMLGLQ